MPATLASRPDPLDTEANLTGMPLWLVLLGMTAALYAAMPFLHQMVYGHDLIVDAAVRDINARVGYTMTSEARSMLATQFSAAPTLVGAVASLAGTLITVLFAGILLNIGSILLGGDHTPAQALAAASWAAVAVAASRFLLWILLLVIQGTHTLTGLGWKARATATLGSVFPEPSSELLFYALQTADVLLLLGAVIAAVALTEQQPRFRFSAAFVVALSWPVTVVAVKVMMSAFLGFPIT